MQPTADDDDATRLAPNPSEAARASVLPVEVPAGSVTLYSSRLWHRGGGHGGDEMEGQGARRFAYLTVAEPGAPAPPGLIHTMARGDVGKWVVGEGGLVSQRDV